MPITATEKQSKAAERKAATVARHAELRAEALRVANRLPPEYQEWGSNRVRAWERVAKRLRGLAKRAELRPGDVRKAINHVKSIKDLTVEQCVELLNGTADEVEAAAEMEDAPA
ncbi:hypothetical protein OU995_21310 [Roseateles sp. SL47]|uniref:PDZ domain-containing protein n=1 Tax=Roseateles sp. SL47 TaxID=2995138 RepID=UPI002270EFFC|nr:hypothetical protein [Roseateles sp. SL47]WAC72085.1 hypothetical protein OU995_21310 [Roseateles sp. SL47]